MEYLSQLYKTFCNKCTALCYVNKDLKSLQHLFSWNILHNDKESVTEPRQSWYECPRIPDQRWLQYNTYEGFLAVVFPL